LIPAGTFSPGHAYLGRLVFASTQALFVDPTGTVGATFYWTQTDFWLKTQGGDSTPPAIASLTITNGATGVPTNVSLGVYFTKPLLNLGPISDGGDSATLSPDRFEVVLYPVTGFMAYQTHQVIFNPIGSALGFGDFNGNPLPQETLVASFQNGATRLVPRQALLSVPKYQGDAGVQVDLKGEPDYSYTLESGTDLVSWSAVATNLAFGGTAHYVITNGIGDVQYFRAVTQ
jgi:hypothetical protein